MTKGIQKNLKRKQLGAASGPNKAFADWVTLILAMLTISATVIGGGVATYNFFIPGKSGLVPLNENGIFDLAKGTLQELRDDGGTNHNLVISGIFSQHNYLRIGLDGVGVQIYAGESLNIGDTGKCQLTLVGLIVEREAGKFKYECN